MTLGLGVLLPYRVPLLLYPFLSEFFPYIFFYYYHFLRRYALGRAGPSTAKYRGNRTE